MATEGTQLAEAGACRWPRNPQKLIAPITVGLFGGTGLARNAALVRPQRVGGAPNVPAPLCPHQRPRRGAIT